MTLARLGLGLAAIGRPAYITSGRDTDLGRPDLRTEHELRRRAGVLLDTAWELGVRDLDAARSYGRAEAFLGAWLAAHPERRRELRIGSKWGYAYVGGWRMDAATHEHKVHTLAMLQAQWPESLNALGTRPDVYLIHSVTPDSPALADSALLEALRRLADTGVRVGISTSGPRQAEVLAEALALADSPFAAVQATWNLLEPSVGPALADAHAAGWTVVVKEALANGRLGPGGDVAELRRLAAADGQTVDAFALGVALAQPWAHVVLSGAVTPEQLRQNHAARAPGLDTSEFAGLAVPTAEYWDERTRRPWR